MLWNLDQKGELGAVFRAGHSALQVKGAQQDVLGGDHPVSLPFVAQQRESVHLVRSAKEEPETTTPDGPAESHPTFPCQTPQDHL